MAAQTVSQIMSTIASTVNLDPSAPVLGSSDYTLWISFMQRAQWEWQEAYDWEETRTWFYPGITLITSASVGPATISLPNDFYKVAGPPINWTANNMNGIPWPEMLPEQRTLFSWSDKWFEVIGEQGGGYSLLWNPGTLSSGVSIEIQYFKVAPSLASAGQIPVMRDPQFIADRTIAYILEGRFDPRYQQVEAKARQKLLLMIDNQNAKKYGSFATPAYVTNATRKMGFRLGRD